MRRHLIVLVAVVAAIGAGFVLFLRHGMAPGASPVPVGSDPVAASRLASKAVAALEKDPKFRREVTRDSGLRPICVARPFGVNPPSGTGAKAETIYAVIYCKWIPDSAQAAPIDTRQLMALTGPIAVHLGSTTTYEMPSDGEHYESSLKKIFPSSLLGAAQDGGDPPSMEQELDKRISRILPTSPSPSST